MMIVIKDRGFNDAVVSTFVFMAPMTIPPMFTAPTNGQGFHCRGRDLVQRSMLQLSMTPQIRLPAK
jgi:hypothetical protein